LHPDYDKFWASRTLSAPDRRIVMKTQMIAFVLLFSVFGALQSTTASAQWRRGGYGGYGWGEGRWQHSWHNGRLGWWWVLGPSWYYYPRPYVQPQTVIIQPAAPVQPPLYAPPVETAPAMTAPPVAQAAPPPVQTMYYCKSTERYYPETMTCPLGWTPVTPGAPPAP
jgi:hypothetical protein